MCPRSSYQFYIVSNNIKLLLGHIVLTLTHFSPGQTWRKNSSDQIDQRLQEQQERVVLIIFTWLECSIRGWTRKTWFSVSFADSTTSGFIWTEKYLCLCHFIGWTEYYSISVLHLLKANKKHAITQMQSRFAAIYETPMSSVVRLTHDKKTTPTTEKSGSVPSKKCTRG